ncbi:MAG TPA: DUF58 domain-containing protein [Steroidobacteraceae bacterium]|nr:DUF58 domain-containing protein [Steroidobacteraceae bacterium]
MKHLLRERMARWIRRRQGLDILPVTLQRRRLYIVPSRAGVAFGLLQILMLVAGLNYANSSALFLTFVLMGFTLVSMHQCHRNLLGLRVIAATALPTFARSPGMLTLVLENPTAPTRYRIAAGLDRGPPVATDVPGSGRQTIALPVAAPRRGIVCVDRVLLITRHPFGLFLTWTWVHTPLQLLVYPYPQGALPMPADSGERPGQRPRTSTGQDEWFGLRPFRDGDSPRQVDWKAYARESPLLVKEYSATASELRMFDFNALAGLPVEERLEQLARWVVMAETAGERYGLLLPGVSIAADHGREHRHRCLASLATFALEEESSAAGFFSPTAVAARAGGFASG